MVIPDGHRNGRFLGQSYTVAILGKRQMMESENVKTEPNIHLSKE
jgi:hypothetical protein